jgi:hypothetical protein
MARPDAGVGRVWSGWVTLRSAAAGLAVAEENRLGYDRDLFPRADCSSTAIKLIYSQY